MPVIPIEETLTVVSIPFIVTIFALLALLVTTIWPRTGKNTVEVLTLLGCVAGLIAAWSLWPRDEAAAVIDLGSIVLDRLALVISILILLNAILIILTSISYCRNRANEHGEFLILLLFSAAGMVLMAISADLMMVFIALETLSIPLYVLAASERESRISMEAGLKYLILGSVGSAIFLYGTALMYGATGTLDLSEIVALISAEGLNPMSGLAAIMLLSAIGFKLSAVPFHMWAPDVYQGSPTPVTALIATGAKAAILVPFLRFAMNLEGDIATDAGNIIAVLAVLTMTVGNILALVQINAKRMLAYSSIAHAGYLLMAFTTQGEDAVSAAVFYITVYSFMNITAFAVISVLEQGGRTVTRYTLRGMARANPGLAVAFVISMLALTGIPPTAGFIGKLLLFKTVIDDGNFALAVVAAVNSLVALFYYLGFATAPFLPPIEEGAELQPARVPAAGFAIAAGAAVTLLLGILPQTVLAAIQAAEQFMRGL